VSSVTVDQVRQFWDQNPLCAAAIPHPLGSREYFEFYDHLREINESVEFSYAFHEYENFSGKKVLDIGCGNGYVLSRFSKEGAKTSGVDITPTGVNLCRKRFEMMGLAGDFQVGNAEELPFPDNTFDCVSSMGVLHHTPNTEKAIGEAFRVLKPGGRLQVMFYHRNSALYRIKFPIVKLLTGKSLQQQVNEVDGKGCPKGDVYSRKELAALLHSFEKVEMFAGMLQSWMILPKMGFLFRPFLLRPFEKRLGWFLYAKGWKPAAGKDAR
jgi:ubiquinone/menaquinone biosynthesis C-methylase UbiE